MPYTRHVAPAQTSTNTKAANDLTLEADAISSSFDLPGCGASSTGDGDPGAPDEGFSPILSFVCQVRSGMDINQGSD
jgi:hypothetical protein